MLASLIINFQASLARPENRHQNPLGNPDLKGKDGDVNEQREKFRGVSYRAVVYRVGMDDPEERILPSQPFEFSINQHAQRAKDRK